MKERPSKQNKVDESIRDPQSVSEWIKSIPALAISKGDLAQIGVQTETIKSFDEDDLRSMAEAIHLHLITTLIWDEVRFHSEGEG